MIQILLKTDEFNSMEYDTRNNSCSFANIKLLRNDDRFINIIYSKEKSFELVVINPSFKYAKKTGYYKFSSCCVCGYNDNLIQINYWQSEKLEGAEERNAIIDFII